MMRLLRSTPIITLSLASSKSTCVTTLRFCRAAISAASFTRFARSAPAKPGVPRATTERSTSSDSGTFLVWTFRIASRPFTSGRPTTTRRSKRPGRSSAGIEHVGTVGRRHQNHAFVRFETVHFDQQLIEGLLALVVSAAQARAAMASHGVDFVDEDDARGVLLALLEQVAHAAGAHAHEHFHEVRSGDGEERHVRFARDGAGQQRLAGSRRADQQHALGNAPAQLLELLRLAQELDDLLQFFLGFLDAGNVFKRHLLLLRGVQAGAALAEAQGLVPAALHLAHHEDPEPGQQHEGEGVDQDRNPAAVVPFRC